MFHSNREVCFFFFADEEVENIEDVGLDKFDLRLDYVREHKKEIFDLQLFLVHLYLKSSFPLSLSCP